MTITKKDIKYSLAAIGISLILFVLLPSCGTTNKVKTSTYTKTDSTTSIKKDTASTTTKDSTHIIKDNTITTKVTDGEFTKVTVIEFDTLGSTNAKDIVWKNGDAIDYIPLRPVKKITIKETGKQSIKEEAHIARIDSAKSSFTISTQAHTEQDTHVSTETTTKSKEVHRTSYGWLWWLILIPLAYIGYRYWKTKLNI